MVTPPADDLIEGNKRSTYRKWKEWAVILTSSQLLFFRDINLAHMLQTQETMKGDDVPQSPQALLRPDETISLKECIAVYDMAYTIVRLFIYSVTFNGNDRILSIVILFALSCPMVARYFCDQTRSMSSTNGSILLIMLALSEPQV
jgi:hypothetical protein